MSTNPDPDGAYSIGAVARLTGISTHALRIWERRYAGVVAGRTASGRRVYTRTDVEKLSLLKLLVDRGLSIGQIAALSLEELRERHRDVAQQISTMQKLGPGAELTVAALAGFSLNRVRDIELPEQLRFSVIDTDYNRFRSDVRRDGADVLLLEFPVVDAECHRRIADLRALSQARRIIVLFNLAHRQELAELAAAKIELLRAPVTMSTLLQTLLSGSTLAQPAARVASTKLSEPAELRLLDEEIPSRRFTATELAAVARMSTALDCECPAHLTELIESLSAFEVYSEQCEARNPNDKALHRYLNGATARARAVMEEALNTLIVQEKLQL